ncbi:MAG: methionine--tRNA ligase [Patescibacteria group bacterium]|nr:methionine--tRNA ligase [Patescibacteria group bacterium]
MSTFKSKFYITSSIAYANAAPHIGYAMEVCQADVLARYHRMLSYDVYFLSGTDENGSKIKKTALENKTEPQKFVDETSAKFQLLLDTLDISNNDFIRTTDKKRHWPAAQKIWQQLVDAGDIYNDKYEGYYCVGCEAYLTEKDLIDGKCPNHQKTPEKISEKNYFFKLSKYSNQILEKIESEELEISPESRKNEILNVIKEGLRDISFSRPKAVLDWGVPVPNDKSQTMYVWCDALTNYISALGYGEDYRGSTSINEKFKTYWPADIHVIGKDILRFHAAIWPAMLISADLPLPKKIFVHGFVTSGGKKMSKSIGNVIDPFEVVNKYGVDALRYYLLKEIPSGGDGDFSFERFEEVYKSDLQNGLGNLIARTLTMPEKYFSNRVPDIDFEKTGQAETYSKNEEDKIFSSSRTEIEKIWKLIDGSINDFKLDRALGLVISFGDIKKENVNGVVPKLNNYIDYSEPWKLIKEDKEKTAIIVYNLLESLRQIAWMIRPFLPETSDKIFAQLFANEKERKLELKKTLKEAQVWGGLKTGTKINKGEILFPRL